MPSISAFLPPCGAMLRPSSFVASSSPRPTHAALRPRRPRNAAPVVAPQMGVFGLGFPELAVIAGVGILIFGPGKIAEMGKELGGVAGSVKKASSEFQEAMNESLADADREIEERKQKKIEIKSDSAKPVDAEVVE